MVIAYLFSYQNFSKYNFRTIRLQHYSDWIAKNQKQFQNYSDFSQ